MLAVTPAVDRRPLFFVLISAVVSQSLCGEGESHSPSLLLANIRAVRDLRLC